MSMKRILVSRSVVDHNTETGDSKQVFTVVDAEGNQHRSSSIIILGPSAVRYDRDGGPGNRVWIETFDKVVLRDADPFVVI
jgi:hypothetical protein